MHQNFVASRLWLNNSDKHLHAQESTWQVFIGFIYPIAASHCATGKAEEASVVGSTPRCRGAWGTAGSDRASPCLSARAGTASREWASPAGFLSARTGPVSLCHVYQHDCTTLPTRCLTTTARSLSCQERWKVSCTLST